MGPSLQAKLLRVLQEREVERLGAKKTVVLDVRVIATTNRDLRAEVAGGRFREDLFYRLNVLPLTLPPLRERPGDILPLVERTLCARRAGACPELSDEAGERLLASHWPGNVRELENLIQRAVVLAGPGRIEVEHLLFESGACAVASVDLPEAQPENTARVSAFASLEDDLRAREKEIIFEALRSGGGSREAAASRLGISPRTLRHKLARFREEGEEIPGETGFSRARAV